MVARSQDPCRMVINAEVFFDLGSGREFLRSFGLAVIGLRVDHVQCIDFVGLLLYQVECSRGIYASRKKD